MDKRRRPATVKGPDATFAGDVWVEHFADGDDESRLAGATVRFTPGARTHWHSHGLGQTLLCLDGEGFVVNRDGDVIVLRRGRRSGRHAARSIVTAARRTTSSATSPCASLPRTATRRPGSRPSATRTTPQPTPTSSTEDGHEPGSPGGRRGGVRAAVPPARRRRPECEPRVGAILRGVIFGDGVATGELDDRTRERVTVNAIATLRALLQLRANDHEEAYPAVAVAGIPDHRPLCSS